MEKAVADLRSHEDCQARLGLTEEAVKSYELAYKAGKSLPALEVFEVDGELIVVDGFHRLEAAKRAERGNVAGRDRRQGHDGRG